MDGFTWDIVNAQDDPTLLEEDREDGAAARPAPREKDRSKKRRGFRGFLKEKASMQDHLLDKLLQQVVPTEDAPPGQVREADVADDSMPAYAERPSFNLTTMSNNFRRFNARIGAVFKFQARMIRLMSWRRPSHTLSFLAVYTFVCLDPYLICVLPLASLLLGVLIPSFVARHPAADHPNLELSYSPRGPPVAPARTVKPVKELSRDFFRNMSDLQNSMEDFSVAHDKIVGLVVPATNFADEALSSAIFVLMTAAGLFMSLAAHLLPWRFLFLGAGWAAVGSGHPAVARILARQHSRHVAPQEAKAVSALEKFVAADIILDSAPETREVEIFELQRLSPAAEWEAWLFCPSPYDPLSAARLAGERPAGTRFFEDVLAPQGWAWSEKKWALDLWSRDWVEERIITGVEVETEGERWVYDIYHEHEAHSGVVETPFRGRTTTAPPSLSWEEGEEGVGRRGEWRRRRWVRLVKRKSLGGAG